MHFSCHGCHTHSPLHPPPYQYAGTTSDAQVAMDKETENKLMAISASYTRRKNQVVEKILDRVVPVKPELHHNLKKFDGQ
jgi:V-type H+-transporting ATPase subunit G